MEENKKIRKYLLILILVSFVIRAVVAWMIELGNDEVYYRLYALYPDWSHFDHPPMVGWVIQLFSLDLTLHSEFFLRLGFVVTGTFNTWIIFLIGREIRDQLTGLYAAILYTASVYCSIIAGIFIMPDGPQVFFWLLTLLFLIRSLPDKELAKSSRLNLLFAGITIGFALLSKYHSVFLLTGAGLYMVFFNRRWFLAKELYIALLLVMIMCIPVILWNIRNDFISFTFHEERVENVSGIRWDFIGTELIGQFFYNNPVNVVVILFSLFALIRRNDFIKKDHVSLLLLVSIPLSLVFLSFSFSNRTLPHWTGPAYLGYILIAAAWLSGRKRQKNALIPPVLKVSAGLLLLLIIFGVAQICYGVIPLINKVVDDPTAQLYGYRQLSAKFEEAARNAEMRKEMTGKAPIIESRWFPAANLDYYIGEPQGRKVYAMGTLERIHKFYWINKDRGLPSKGSYAWYIGFSDDSPEPSPTIQSLFDSVACRDTLTIIRNDQVIRKAYLFRLYGWK